MELHHLRCAVAIADHGSFTDAAAALHLTQPALSYAIARLERELGTRLFDRSPIGSTLTAAGRAFVGPARRALQEAESGKAAVDAVTGLLSGELRLVGIRTAVMETARLAAEFHRRHPGVRMVLEEPARDREVVELLRSGRCDVAVMRTELVPADLVSLPAGSRDIVVIFPPGSAPERSAITTAYLGRIPMVVPLPATSARAGHDAFFRDVDPHPPIAAECSHQDTVVELVRGGVGAAIVSSSHAATLESSGIEVRALHPRRSDRLSVVQRTSTSPAAEAFFSVVVASAGRPVPATHDGRPGSSNEAGRARRTSGYRVGPRKPKTM